MVSNDLAFGSCRKAPALNNSKMHKTICVHHWVFCADYSLSAGGLLTLRYHCTTAQCDNCLVITVPKHDTSDIGFRLSQRKSGLQQCRSRHVSHPYDWSITCATSQYNTRYSVCILSSFSKLALIVLKCAAHNQ